MSPARLASVGAGKALCDSCFQDKHGAEKLWLQEFATDSERHRLTIGLVVDAEEMDAAARVTRKGAKKSKKGLDKRKNVDVYGGLTGLEVGPFPLPLFFFFCFLS